VGLLVLLPILLVAMLALSLVLVALRDFVAPLQMLHETSCRPALETFLGILRGQPGVFVVYVLLKIVFAVAVVTASMVVGCVTCCFGFLPVVMQTLLQPAFYFERAWSLCLLRQAGHDVFAAGAPTGGGLDALQASPPEPSPLPPPPSP
jgi:hypothetical protein